MAGFCSMFGMDTKPIDPAAIRAQVAALPNIEAFARDSGLPLRTLQRLVASAKPGAAAYRPSTVTLRAIDAVLNPPEPKKRRARKVKP